MKPSRSCSVLALCVLLPAGVAAQEPQPPYGAAELAAILAPFKSSVTRGLKPGDGSAAPGTQGSGVVPDLRVHFATGSARLSPEAGRQLAALARVEPG
jgi:hypothetical protein